MLCRVGPQGAIDPSRVWCLLNSFFGCVACVADWFTLWCYLNPTTGCFSSESTWVDFRYRSLSDIVCNLFWAACLELPCCLLFVFTFIGPGCACKGQFV